MKKSNPSAVIIKVKNPTSQFVALDIRNKFKVLAEGKTVEYVFKKAQKTGKKFSMMWIPLKGKRYVFCGNEANNV